MNDVFFNTSTTRRTSTIATHDTGITLFQQLINAVVFSINAKTGSVVFSTTPKERQCRGPLQYASFFAARTSYIYSRWERIQPMRGGAGTMTVNSIELERACAHLLGSDFCARPGWQGCLDSPLLKRAFRKKVFAVHPDRATSLGIPAAILQERFVKLQQSYDHLVRYLSHTTSAATPSAPVRATKPRKKAEKVPTVGSYYFGQRPSRPLKIGEFLYYGGCISQEQLFGAVRWQSRQRPRIGEIAMSFGYLDTAGISHLLELRQSMRILHEPLAEFARNQGYLTHFQWLAVVGRQRRLQKPIGQYWIETGLFIAEEISELVSDQRQHNWYFTPA